MIDSDTLMAHEARISVMESKFMSLEKQLIDTNNLLCSQNQAILQDLQTIKNQRIAEEERWNILTKLGSSRIIQTILVMALFYLISQADSFQQLLGKL